jgi:hypothetical protein
MSERIHCPRCERSRPAVIETDMHGHTIDLTPACDCAGRPVKVCLECKATFLSHRRASGARWCKDCVAERRKESGRAAVRRYDERNREKKLAKSRAYKRALYADAAGRRLCKKRYDEWYARNREKRLQYLREYHRRAA